MQPGSFEAKHVAAEDKFDRDKFDREKLVEISVVRQVDRGELIGVSFERGRSDRGTLARSRKRMSVSRARTRKRSAEWSTEERSPAL